MITFMLVWVLNVVDNSSTNTVQYQYTYMTQQTCEMQKKRVIESSQHPTWLKASCHFSQVPVYVPTGAPKNE